MLGLLADLAGNAIGDVLVELLVTGLIQPFQWRRPQVKSEFGMI
jgi:hypothetical protein